MRTVSGLDNVSPDLAGGVLSIGNFDGVHLGHRLILDRGVELAAGTAGPLVVMTFSPHPLAVLRPDRAPPTLTPLEEKLAQLERAGADAVVVVPVDTTFLAIEADDFVRRIVAERFAPRFVVEGPSFNYGRGRQGDNETLRAAGRRHGFEVHVVESVEVETDAGCHEMVSSSLIRRAVSAGDMDLARRALGRPYALLGRVVEGRRRGRKLGYPTANLDAGPQLLPADGVYAGAATVAGREYPAAISIGRAPTFNETKMLVEAHLLGFNGDVYGKPIRVEVETRLRGQEAFDSPAALCEQIERDVAAARAVFERRRPAPDGG